MNLFNRRRQYSEKRNALKHHKIGFPAIIFSHPTWGYFLFNQCLHVMHNYTKIKGLQSRKITLLPNLHASFKSSPTIYRMPITRLICIQWKSPQFLSPVSTVFARNAWRGLQTRSHGQKKENNCIFRFSLCLSKLD